MIAILGRLREFHERPLRFEIERYVTKSGIL